LELMLHVYIVSAGVNQACKCGRLGLQR